MSDKYVVGEMDMKVLLERMEEGTVTRIFVESAYVVEGVRVTQESVTSYPCLVVSRKADDGTDEFFAIAFTPFDLNDPKEGLSPEKQTEIEDKLIDLVRTTFLQES